MQPNKLNYGTTVPTLVIQGEKRKFMAVIIVAALQNLT